MDQQDLSSIKWAHAVNSKSFLQEILEGNVHMVEADVLMGTLKNGDGTQLAIMAHPPLQTSDLSLLEFIAQIDKYNKLAKNEKKGMKLDFKTIAAFEAAVNNKNFVDYINKADYPVWLNADIVEGPLANPKQIPVDPTRFFKGAKLFPNCVLSLGWTTGFASTKKAGYSVKHISDMLELIKNNDINHEITFAVRAGLVAESMEQMIKLTENSKNTLTLWSAVHDDGFDLDKLNTILKMVSLEKVYVDVPDKLRGKLDLGDRKSVV